MPPPSHISCPHFSVCGGCESLDVDYDQQVAQKDSWLRTLFQPLEKETPIPWLPFLGCNPPVYYRNKIRYGFCLSNGKISIARHAKGNMNAEIPIDSCLLQSPFSVEIARFVADNAKFQIKHVIVREGKRTGHSQLCLVTDYTALEDKDEFINSLLAKFPNLTSLYQLMSWGKNNEHIEPVHLYGQTGIQEKVGGKLFYISPLAFFQTNSRMVEPLYSCIRKLAGNPRVIYDLYAGSASIGIFLSDIAEQIISIESNPDNIADAKINLEINGIKNVLVFEGEVEKVLDSKFLGIHAFPDLVIVDPPRSGLSRQALNLLANLAPKRVIYVSCNPITLKRDLLELTAFTYKISSLQGLDCFPHTPHCEMVVALDV